MNQSSGRFIWKESDIHPSYTSGFVLQFFKVFFSIVCSVSTSCSCLGLQSICKWFQKSSLEWARLSLYKDLCQQCTAAWTKGDGVPLLFERNDPLWQFLLWFHNLQRLIY